MQNRYFARLRRADPQVAGRWAKRQAKAAVARSGYLVTKIDDEARRYVSLTNNEEVPLPPDAAQALQLDNPKHLELQAAYDALDLPAAAPTQWHAGWLKRNLSMAWFRGDNAYVWQFRQLGTAANLRMYLTLLDVESRDRLGLLGQLDEDGLFGAWTFSLR